MEEKVRGPEFLARGVRTRSQSKSPVEFQAVVRESPQKRRRTSQLLFDSPQPRSPFRIVKLGAGFSASNGDSPVTPVRPGTCKCKHSYCLKLYCLCFESGKYCDGCSCKNCNNTAENEDARQAALISIVQRHKSMEKYILSPKFSVYNKGSGKENLILVNPVGCCCKKSHCIQGYCVCYQANMFCSESCNCFNCQNDKSRNAISPNGSTNSGEKENFIDLTVEDQPSSSLGQSWKAVRQRTSRSLNFSHRSILAATVKLQNLMEFCRRAEMTDCTNPFNLEGGEQQQKVQSDPSSGLGVDLSGVQANARSHHLISDDCIQKERPVSAKTVSLTRESVITPAAIELIRISDCFSEDCVEQEKLVLLKFQEFLTRLISSIHAKGQHFSSTQHTTSVAEHFLE